jgi:hypothetical protein
MSEADSIQPGDRVSLKTESPGNPVMVVSNIEDHLAYCIWYRPAAEGHPTDLVSDEIPLVCLRKID